MRSGLHKALRGGVHRVFRDAALLGGPCGRVAQHRAAEFFEAFAIARDEVRVEGALERHLAHDAQQECQLRAGAHGNPFVGEHICARIAGIDGHHGSAVFARLREFLHLGRANRLVAACIEHDGVFRICRVEHRRGTQKRCIRRIDVGVHERGIVEVIRRTHGCHETLGIPRIGCAAVLEQCRLSIGAGYMVGDIGKRIVPAYVREAALAVSLQGFEHAVFGSRERRQSLPAAAQVSAGMRMAFGAHEAPQLLVAHPCFDAACVRAARAQRRRRVRGQII